MHTDHDSPLCGALGHYVATLTLVYCPHHQAWIMIERAGDDADDMCLESARFDFGPFDSTDEVASHAASVVHKLVRVTSRRWLAQRASADGGQGRRR
jgi:hypothetical protein